MEKAFIGKIPKKYIEKIHILAKSPSNIALVKYWGKKENQIPCNPSLSFTLKNCQTKTNLIAQKIKNPTKKVAFEVFFEGVLDSKFNEKMAVFFERIYPYLPFLKAYHFEIHTENSFPHSSGIASSASGMAAISIALMRLEKEFFPEMTKDFFLKKASFLARLGSGSACRSIAGNWILWGKHEIIKESSDTYGIHLKENIHPIFKNYKDSILIVDKKQKQISSSKGHRLMCENTYAKERFKQAYQNTSILLDILKKGDLEHFIKLVESEALTLHAMMMCSQPYFILMQPKTLEIIKNIWAFRKEKKIPVCFTLDAGANVHLLYPEKFSEEIQVLIEQNLKIFCENQQVIQDEIGQGSEVDSIL